MSWAMEESKVADLVSLDELLSWRAQQRGDAPLFAWWEDRNAMVKTTRSLSYADVDVAASRVAERLRSELAPGDRAVLVFEPGLAFIAQKRRLEGSVCLVYIKRVARNDPPFNKRGAVAAVAQTRRDAVRVCTR